MSGGGVPQERLALTTAVVHASVHDYLVDVGAYGKYPGLTYAVTVDPGDPSVTVRVHAPLELPLTIPGSPERTQVSAVVSVD